MLNFPDPPLTIGQTFVGGGLVWQWDGTKWLSNAPTTLTLTGDVTGSGSGSISTSLPTVNSNVGTYQGLTVNAKGQVTAAANQNYQKLITVTAAFVTPSIGNTVVVSVSDASSLAVNVPLFIVDAYYIINSIAGNNITLQRTA